MGDLFNSLDSLVDSDTPDTPDLKYTAPDIQSLYSIFKDTGKVPYSYYGQGAPTRASELELLKQAYPSAFSANTQVAKKAPPKMDPMSQAVLGVAGLVAPAFGAKRNPFPDLFQVLRGGY